MWSHNHGVWSWESQGFGQQPKPLTTFFFFLWQRLRLVTTNIACDIHIVKFGRGLRTGDERQIVRESETCHLKHREERNCLLSIWKWKFHIWFCVDHNHNIYYIYRFYPWGSDAGNLLLLLAQCGTMNFSNMFSQRGCNLSVVKLGEAMILVKLRDCF